MSATAVAALRSPKEWALMSTLDRLFAFITKSEDGCWIWGGQLSPDGYGITGYKRRTRLAHRAMYLELVGSIPDGMDLDHTCHTNDPTCPAGNTCPHRRCVNPSHLEPCTRQENNARSAFRRTHCKRGHPFDDDNTMHMQQHGKKPVRRCRRCHRLTLEPNGAPAETDVGRAVEASGISYNRLDYYVTQGWLRPEGGVGTGRPRKWSDEELEVAARMGRYVELGIKPPLAAYAARNDGRLPGGYRIIPDEAAELAPEPEAVVA